MPLSSQHYMRYDLRKIGKKAGPQTVSPNHIKKFCQDSFFRKNGRTISEDLEFRTDE